MGLKYLDFNKNKNQCILWFCNFLILIILLNSTLKHFLYSFDRIDIFWT